MRVDAARHDSGSRRRLSLLVHHGAGEREYSYGRLSSIGRLDRAWDDAGAHGGNVITIKSDCEEVFPPNKN